MFNFRQLLCRHEWWLFATDRLQTPTYRVVGKMHKCQKCKATKRETRTLPIAGRQRTPGARPGMADSPAEVASHVG